MPATLTTLKDVALEPGEAVAVIRALARRFPLAFDPKTDVQRSDAVIRAARLTCLALSADGEVLWESSEPLTGVHEAATLLDALLASAARTPGPLRYIVARGLRTVDAPGFPSLAAFSEALARFAPPDEGATLRALYARSADHAAPAAHPPQAPTRQLVAATSGLAPVVPFPARSAVSEASPPVVDRRRVSSQVTELRRQLRDADLRLFAQMGHDVPPLATAASVRAGVARDHPTGPSAVAVASPSAHQARTRRPASMAAAAAALFAVVLSGVSGFLFVQRHGTPSSRPAVVATPGSTAAVLPPVTDPPPDVPLSTGPISTVPLTSADAAATDVAASSAEPPSQPAGPRASADAAGADGWNSSAGVADARARTDAGSATETGAPATQPSDNTGQLVSEVDRQQRPVFSPAFARTESAIFFHTGGNGDSRSALAKASVADGSGELRVITLVDDGARNYHVQPSPDGRWIAFDSDRDGERGVYVARQDGTSVRRVSGDGYAAVPTWSPDGRRLTFVRAEAQNSRVWNLWLLPLADDVVSTDPSTAQRLTHLRYGQPWGASWFPDGHRIAYSHEDTLTVLDLENGRARDFHSPLRGRLVRTPAVSPDGGRIIFQVYRDGAWLLDLEDGAMRRVLNDPSAEEFAWSPNGQRVAYHSRRDHQWGIHVLAGN